MKRPALRISLLVALMHAVAVLVYVFGSRRTVREPTEQPPVATTPSAETPSPPVTDVIARPAEGSPARTDTRPDAARTDGLDPEHVPEPALMEAVARAVAREPARALQLIEVADRRFGSDHEQRRRLEIEALVGLEQIGRSHAKAEHFYRQYPNSPAARDVERLTGYHPRPWGPRR